jgi:WD40 repeat protein
MDVKQQSDSSEIQRADVFISHSRKDKGFVRHLAEMLEKSDRRAWVDVESITPTAEFWPEVYSGIEETDALIFVISPDSVRSEDCKEELAHAVEHNKRLVPIVFREVDDEEVPGSLRSLQWIFFGDGDEFESSFQELVDALDTDLAWLKVHTRLDIWASAWDKSGRDNSFLLRGSDLRTAEEWQVRAADKEPKLTPLQVEYVLVGRKAASRRQRVTLGAVTFGLVIVAVLGFIAWWQRNEANDQANIALSRQLAAQAELKANSDPQLATLLSVAAYDAKDTPEARSNLVRQLDRLQHIVRFLSLHIGRVSRVAFSPDGRTLVAAGEEDTVLWNITKGARLATLPNASGTVAFSPDGRKLAVAGEKNIVLWDVTERRHLATLPTDSEDSPKSVPIAWSPDGRTLAIGGVDYTKIVLWDVAKRKQFATLTVHIPGQTAPATNGASALAFSPDGQTLAADGPNGGDIVLWDVAKRIQVADLRGGHTRGIFSLAFSPDGRTIASGGHDARIVLWDVAKRKQLATLDADGDVLDVAFSPNEDTLASADGGKHVILWDTTRHTRNATLTGHTDAVQSVAFSPDGRTVASGGADENVVLWDLAGQSHIVFDTLPSGPVVFSTDGHLRASGDGKNVIVWDIAHHTRLATLPDAGTPEVFSPDGRTLVAASEKNVTLWDVTQRRQLATLPDVTGTLGSGLPSALSPNGRTLAIADPEDKNIILWDIVRHAQLATLTQDSGVFSLAFSPDGDTLASGGVNEIVLWDVARRTQLSTLPGHNLASGVQGVAFSSDGHTFASTALDQAMTALGCAGCNVILWDLSQRTEIATLSGHTSMPLDVAFSPDGSMLASATADEVILWSVAQRAQLSTMTDGSSPLAFSPDRQTLASGSGDGTILWDVDVTSWRSKLCAVAGRDLSKEEWETYLTGRPYQPTCS